jgi:hypothetical protein
VRVCADYSVAAVPSCFEDSFEAASSSIPIV